MADFENGVSGGMPEDTSISKASDSEATAGAGGIGDNDLWGNFFDDGVLEPDGPDSGDAGGENGGDAGGENGGGGEPAGQQGSQPAFPNVDEVVQQRVDAAIARQFGGMINPYTGRPITTEAELAAYQQAFAAEEQERRLRESGIDRNILNEAISGHPVVQQANAMLHEQQQRQANDFMSQEFAALLQEFPDCGLKDARDLMDTPEGRETLNLWRSGPISLKTAYAATHLKEIQARQSKAVRQGVMNEVNGRAHLTQTNRGGQANGEMPAETMEQYRTFGIGKDDAERLEIWKRVHAGG